MNKAWLGNKFIFERGATDKHLVYELIWWSCKSFSQVTASKTSMFTGFLQSGLEHDWSLERASNLAYILWFSIEETLVEVNILEVSLSRTSHKNLLCFFFLMRRLIPFWILGLMVGELTEFKNQQVFAFTLVQFFALGFYLLVKTINFQAFCLNWDYSTNFIGQSQLHLTFFFGHCLFYQLPPLHFCPPPAKFF